MTAPEPAARRAGADDLAAAVEVLVGAFRQDPTWSWALADPVHRPARLRQLWSLFLAGSMRYQEVWLTPDNTAASAWIPPGGTDLSAEQESELEALIPRLGPDADRVRQLIELFEQAHPRTRPHFYLSLLGTDPNHRGRGYGLRLLAGNLRRIDQLAMPAYLEASNQVNVALYARYGFVVRDTLRPRPDGPPFTTMWREARPAQA